MSALTMMLIRYAEKPDNPILGSGLTEQGDVDKHSIRGWQRAGALVALFGSGAFGTNFSIPNAVYSADPSKPPTEDGSVSKRPCQTIPPLCQKLHITPITKYGVGGEVPMLNEVRDCVSLLGASANC